MSQIPTSQVNLQLQQQVPQQLPQQVHQQVHQVPQLPQSNGLPISKPITVVAQSQSLQQQVNLQNLENAEDIKIKRLAGRKTGARGYSPPELQVLFSLIRRFKPTGRDGWTKVAISFNAIAADQGLTQREPDSLRKKFQKLVNHHKSTFDPNCPWEVKQAKRVQRELANFALGYDMGGEAPVGGGGGGQEEGGLFGFSEGDILAALESANVNKGNASPIAPGSASPQLNASVRQRGRKRQFSSILQEAQTYLNTRRRLPNSMEEISSMLKQSTNKKPKSEDASVLLAMLISQQQQHAQQIQQQQHTFMHMMQQQHQQVIAMMMMLAKSNLSEAINNMGGPPPPNNYPDLPTGITPGMSGMTHDHAAMRPVLASINAQAQNDNGQAEKKV